MTTGKDMVKNAIFDAIKQATEEINSKVEMEEYCNHCAVSDSCSFLHWYDTCPVMNRLADYVMIHIN